MVGAIAVAAGATALWMGLALRAQVQSGATKIGGPFTLVDDTGVQVSEADLKGKSTVMYFGYTFCPEVCPTTLTDLVQWMQMIGRDADRLNYVFVTVDPERDTPKVMHDYVSAFDPRIRGLTGTSEQIAKVTKEIRRLLQADSDLGWRLRNGSLSCPLYDGPERKICWRHPLPRRYRQGRR